jgi:hypothetical protein
VIRQPSRAERPVYHLVDIVHERDYPNIADFVEEVRRMGLSRPLDLRLPVERLGAGSRIILIHRKAWVDHWSEIRSPLQADSASVLAGFAHRCPRADPMADPQAHALGREMCAGVWWEDLDPDTVCLPEVGPQYQIERRMPSFSYTGKVRPDSIDTQYDPAFFASFPIGRLVVIEGDGSDAALERARASMLRVDGVAA